MSTTIASRAMSRAINVCSQARFGISDNAPQLLERRSLPPASAPTHAPLSQLRTRNLEHHRNLLLGVGAQFTMIAGATCLGGANRPQWKANAWKLRIPRR